jgi:hypothetical protein
MASVKNGFLGNASGKVGNVVFSKHKSTETVRSYQPIISNPKTAAQQQTRFQFSAITCLLQKFPKRILSDLVLNSPSKKSVYNQLMKLNFKTFLPSDQNPLQSFNFVVNPDFLVTVKSSSYDPLFDFFSFTSDCDLYQKNQFSPFIFSVFTLSTQTGNPTPACFRPKIIGWGNGQCIVKDWQDPDYYIYENRWVGGWMCLYNEQVYYPT